MKFPINQFFCGFFAFPFITKAEFDSLKNNFQSQIDQYNSSIDSKIDGAIAAYLAGIKLSNTTRYNVLAYDDTDKAFYFVNGTFFNEGYAINKINYQYTLGLGNQSTFAGYNDVLTTGLRSCTVEGALIIAYETNWSDNELNQKVLAEFRQGDQTNFADIYWNGVALRYIENWQINISNYGSANIGWFDTTQESTRVYLQNPFNINTNGYVEDLNSTTIATNINASFQSNCGTSTYSTYISPAQANTNYITTGAALFTINDATHNMTRTCVYKAAQVIKCHNVNATNHLRKNVDNIYTDATLWALVNNSTNRKYNGYAKNIYQYPKDKKLTTSTDWEVGDLTMQQGLPVFAGQKDEKVEFTAVFPSIQCYNQSSAGSSTYTQETNKNEIEIYLSKSPFNDTITPSDSAHGLIKPEDGSDY